MKRVGIRRVISCMLACVIAFATAFTIAPGKLKAAEEVVFTMTSDKETLHRGDTFTVSVSMAGNTTGEGLTYNLIFDEEKLELIGSERGEVMSGQFDTLTNYPAGSTNSIRAVIIRNEEAIPNGTLMTATFKVKDSALGSAAFDTSISLLNFNLENIPYSIANNIQSNIVIPAIGISLDKHELILNKGEKDTLIATVSPTDSSEAIVWDSDNKDVVTVDDNGNLTAVSGGTANITVKAGNHSDVCKVTVFVPLNGLMIQSDSTTIMRGEEKELEVAYDPQDTSETEVVWTSSAPDIVAVDPSTGKITGLKEGTSDITVTGGAENTISDTVTITVEENKLEADLGNTITFDEMQEALLKGQSIDLTDFWNLDEIVTNNQITDEIFVEWSSSDTEVASVDEKGVVYGVQEGTSTITADITAIDGSGNTRNYVADIDVTVREIPLESIAFDKVITEMQVGETTTLSILFNPENTTDSKNVEWITSDESVISVENGTLHALKVGTAEIIAKVGDKTATCTIEVKDTPKVEFNGTTGHDNQTMGNNPGNTSGVRTGDESNLMICVMLMVMAAGMMITLVIRQRNRQK